MHNSAQFGTIWHNFDHLACKKRAKKIRQIMATLKFYLDTRHAKKDGTFPLKIKIAQKKEAKFVNLNVSLKTEQWDSMENKIINHKRKSMLNSYIKERMMEVENMVYSLMKEGKINSMDVTSIKNEIMGIPEEEEEQSTFVSQFRKFIENKDNPRTKDIYQNTLNRIMDFCPDCEDLKFEDINKDWLTRFDRYMAKRSPSKNARNIHFRNIRAVFNEAIDDGITSFYPFRKFKIKNVETPKRSLSVGQLRELFNFPCEEYEEKYLDMFKLIFYLAGINIVDLCHLKKTDLNNGRIEYYRAKTSRLYSIKVEPEAMEIIEKYKGVNWLLDILDRYEDYRDYARRMNCALKSIGYTSIKKHGRKVKNPLFPHLTTYWARHTWATLAAELDIPKETIAAALGHEIGSPITSIYINFDQKKVDKANRMVIDYLKEGL